MYNELFIPIKTNNSYHLLGKPTPPKNLTVKEVKDDFVDLVWELPESDGGSPILKYVVERKEAKKPTFISAGTTAPDQLQSKVAKLVEDTEYVFRVAAVNESGQSDWVTLDKPVKVAKKSGQ